MRPHRAIALTAGPTVRAYRSWGVEDTINGQFLIAYSSVLPAMNQ
jgi:hypothetical protein